MTTDRQHLCQVLAELLTWGLPLGLCVILPLVLGEPGLALAGAGGWG